MRKLMLILVVAVCSIGPLSAGVLTYTITPTAGQFSYQFTLTNTGDTGGPLYDLFVSLPTDILNIDTSTIGTPAGWGDGTGGQMVFGPDTAPGTSFIDWASDFSGLYDVGIGNSLSGFFFLSSQPITGPILFSLNGFTPLEAAIPASVPEPSTFVMLLIPISLVMGARLRSRRLGTF